ncbi:MAG: GldG family protein [Chitinispirillaceae bacterium]|nr:GldG family protein [Chitinispirillaceae bacterium]
METQKIKNRTELIVYILAILGLVAVVNYFGIRWFKRIDMTEDKQYSVSSATKKVLKGLDDIINIKVFFSKNLPPHMHKTVTDVKDILSEYQAYAGKNLLITWEDPAENEDTKNLARSLGIPEVQLQTFEKDRQQVMNGYLGIAVLFEDKKEALPVVQNLQNLEYDLTMAIMKVSRSVEPHVGVLKMDTMPDLPPQYQAKVDMSGTTQKKLEQLITALRNTYKVSVVDLSKGEPIDSTIKTLIVPGVENVKNRKLFEIDQFFMKGGNLIMLADAMEIQFQYGIRARPQDSKVFDLLEHYGARVEKSLVLDASCGQVTIPQKYGPIQMNVPVPYPYFVRIGKSGFNSVNPAVAPLTEVVTPWVSPVTLLVDKADSAAADQKVKATVLAHSSEKSWTAQGSMDLNPQQQWAIPPEADMKQQNLMVYLNGSFTSYFAGKKVPPVHEPAANDTMSQINLTPEADDASREVVESNTDGHLVVIGDADMVAGQNATPNNVSLVLNLVDWLSLDNNLIAIRTRTMKDRTMNADLLQEGSSKPNLIRLVNILLMPVILVVIGLLIYFKRREPAAMSAAPSSAPATSGTPANKEENKG